MRDEYIDTMRTTISKYSITELHTASEVDDLFSRHKGTMLVFVNSACGCAARVARPALAMALEHTGTPGVVATVFASSEREATAQARKYFADEPASSPSFAFLLDGKCLGMVHRSDIETSTPENVARLLTDMFDKYFTNG